LSRTKFFKKSPKNLFHEAKNIRMINIPRKVCKPGLTGLKGAMPLQGKFFSQSGFAVLIKPVLKK